MTRIFIRSLYAISLWATAAFFIAVSRVNGSRRWEPAAAGAGTENEDTDRFHPYRRRGSGVLRPRAPESPSALGDGQCDEQVAVLARYLHQDRLAAGLGRVLHRLGDIVGAIHCRRVDGGDDVARLDAALRRVAVGIDIGDDKALAVIRGGDGQAEIGKRARLLLRRSLRINRRLLLLARQFTEFELHGLVLAVAPHSNVDRLAGLIAGNEAGEFARRGNVLAVDLGDHVAGDDAGIFCRAVGL